jgi:hypothetical protein
MSQSRQMTEERMKTRIFSVLGLLLLCGVITTWGSKAWAGTCSNTGPGGACMSGTYSCTGFGFYDDGDSKEDSFTTQGILIFAAGLASPPFAPWVINNAGEAQFDIPVSVGAISENGSSGQGELHLAFASGINPEFDFDGDKTKVPENFNYVASNINIFGIPSQFTLQAIPADDQLDLIWLMECDLQ